MRTEDREQRRAPKRCGQKLHDYIDRWSTVRRLRTLYREAASPVWGDLDPDLIRSQGAPGPGRVAMRGESRNPGLPEMSIQTATSADEPTRGRGHSYLAALPRMPVTRVSFRALRNSMGSTRHKLRYRDVSGTALSLHLLRTTDYRGHRATPRIDHWYPLSRDPESRPPLAESLSVVPLKPETCDSAKGDRPLRWDDADPHMPWPVDLRYEDVVGFTRRGEIYVR